MDLRNKIGKDNKAYMNLTSILYLLALKNIIWIKMYLAGRTLSAHIREGVVSQV